MVVVRVVLTMFLAIAGPSFALETSFAVAGSVWASISNISGWLLTNMFRIVPLSEVLDVVASFDLFWP